MFAPSLFWSPVTPRLLARMLNRVAVAIARPAAPDGSWRSIVDREADLLAAKKARLAALRFGLI